MTKKHKIEMIIAAMVVVALLVVLLLLLTRDKVKEQQPTDSVRPSPSVLLSPSVAPENVPSRQTVTASTTARVFAERFGSFSSQSDFANIDDVLPLATPELQRQLKALASASRASEDAGEVYYGTSTRVISVKVDSQTDTAATISCVTQRISSVENPGNSTTTYQTLVLTLQQIDGEWKVDSYTWQ